MKVCARLSAEAKITQEGRPRITDAIIKSTEERDRLRLYSIRLSVRMSFSPECLFLALARGRQGRDRSQIDRQALAGRLRISLHTLLVHMFVIPNLAGNFHVQNEFIELVYHRDDICTFCQARLID